MKIQEKKNMKNNKSYQMIPKTLTSKGIKNETFRFQRVKKNLRLEFVITMIIWRLPGSRMGLKSSTKL